MKLLFAIRKYYKNSTKIVIKIMIANRGILRCNFLCVSVCIQNTIAYFTVIIAAVNEIAFRFLIFLSHCV